MNSKHEKPVKPGEIDRRIERKQANDDRKKSVPPHRLSQFGKDRKQG
jgi:hypothetical protein